MKHCGMHVTKTSTKNTPHDHAHNRKVPFDGGICLFGHYFSNWGFRLVEKSGVDPFIKANSEMDEQDTETGETDDSAFNVTQLEKLKKRVIKGNKNPLLLTSAEILRILKNLDAVKIRSIARSCK